MTISNQMDIWNVLEIMPKIIVRLSNGFWKIGMKLNLKFRGKPPIPL